jgi:phosphoenolpyruvate synthase/pyruvate phosphate dikinase
LHFAIRAVFDSWTGERAVQYRRINHIPDDWGTAVNVQQMVFGNKGDASGSGVAFSRDELTGEPEPSGDYLPNAQGEDVVSGARTPLDIGTLQNWLPDVQARLTEILRALERHYGDMQDTEFTVEDGRLYMLQTRSAKRPAQAAVRFAVDAVAEGLLDRSQALATIDAEQLDALLHPTLDRAARYDILASGVAASPGAAQGQVVFLASDAVVAAAAGRHVVLVRPSTEADDVAGFHAAVGVLTSEGGKSSHAALVARGMGVPAVTGAADLEIDVNAREVRIDGRIVLREGDVVTIDGTTGAVTTDDVERARASSAAWISIGCRGPSSGSGRAHRWSPYGGERRWLSRSSSAPGGQPDARHRGVRLDLLHLEIYEMQVRSIFRALLAARRRGVGGHAEILVPLVNYRRELELLLGLIRRAAETHGLQRGEDYTVGTMIELPRACLRADDIAHEADFFSFGTNDLTQTALGFSRDDIESRILSRYIEGAVFERSPFETLDALGVGQLVRIGAWLGRKTNRSLKLGVCGEHAGDPDSIDFFHRSGLDYVSCSPFRVPVARVAAAQAAIRARS